jgi:hypothetical protein
VDSSESLIRIDKHPQNPSYIAKASHPGVLAIEKSQGAVLLGVVESHPFL